MAFELQKNDVVLGVTLGTGLGFGLVINGQSFTGGNGMAMEYGLSPFEWGIAEKNVCIEFIRNRSKELYGRRLSQKKLKVYGMKEMKKQGLFILNLVKI